MTDLLHHPDANDLVDTGFADVGLKTLDGDIQEDWVSADLAFPQLWISEKTAIDRSMITWVQDRLRMAVEKLDEITEVDASKVRGTPVVAGTRFPISRLLAELADDQSISEISDDFDLDREKAQKIVQCIAVFLDRSYVNDDVSTR